MYFLLEIEKNGRKRCSFGDSNTNSDQTNMELEHSL